MEPSDDSCDHCFAECGVLLGESPYPSHAGPALGLASLCLSVPRSNVSDFVHVHTLTGFYVVSLPLYQPDMLARAALSER